MGRTIKSIGAGRVTVVLRETGGMGKALYVAEPGPTGFARSSVLVATTKGGALALAEALRELADEL